MQIPYTRLMSHLIPIIDRRIWRLRAAAIERLELTEGDWVIDAGCGIGSNFPYLLDAVGPSGHVVGIEVDPTMADSARACIDSNGWHNVELIHADAQSVDLQGQRFDALLMFAAHEVLTSPQALDRLLGSLKDNARIVTLGARQTDSLQGRVLSPLFRLMSKYWLPLSPPIDAKPWSLLEARAGHVVVEQRALGIFYLVSASWPAVPSAR